MIRFAPLLLLAAPLLVAAAPATAPPAAGQQRVSTLVVYGDDPCPKSSGDEIVVCARQPESERYRIPKRFREPTYNAARDGSWAGTVKVLEAAGQQNIPNSCSANGTWGQTGCWDRFMADARAERQAQQAQQAQPPQ